MRISKALSFALCVTAAAAFAGCSGGASQPPGLGQAGLGADAVGGRHVGMAVLPGGTEIKRRPDHRRSWISPDLLQGNPRLLYISDFSTGDVSIFLLSHVANGPMRLKGTLTGFNEPQGLCEDAAGNMWITATGSEQIFKYSRAGALLATLNDPDGGPGGCSVNPVNGDLAVANQFNGPPSGPSGPGEVLVYPNGSGTPAVYANYPAQYQYWYPAYDPQGNLFFNGCTGSNSQCVDQFILSELPVGTMTPVTVNVAGGTIGFPGMIQWYSPGNYLAVADQECKDAGIVSCIYPATISGSTATLGASIALNNSNGTTACDIVQPTINTIRKKMFIAGADYTPNCGGNPPDTAYRWAFPTGGNPTQSNAYAGFVSPWGSGISTH